MKKSQLKLQIYDDIAKILHFLLTFLITLVRLSGFEPETMVPKTIVISISP